MIRIGGALQANISASMVATCRRNPSTGSPRSQGVECDWLHELEYAMSPGPKAIVKSLWSGGDVMVARGGY